MYVTCVFDNTKKWMGIVSWCKTSLNNYQNFTNLVMGIKKLIKIIIKRKNHMLLVHISLYMGKKTQ